MILFFKSWVKPFTYVNAQGTTVHVPGYSRKDAQRGVPDDVKASFVRRYQAGESCPEIAASVGMSTSAVWNAVKDAQAIRPHSEAMALRMAKHPNLSHHRGVQLAFHSQKASGWVPAGSRYEFIRMDQLENDPAVLKFERTRDRIPYSFDGAEHHYIPDLTVKYIDGTVVVEEIKPRNMTLGGKVHTKILAALEFYRKKGVAYRVITEDDIGQDTIRHFDWTGLSGLINADREAERQEKERDRHRESKRKKLASMTDDERAERNRLQRESYRAKEWSEEALAERRRKNAEAKKASRARKSEMTKSTVALFFRAQDSQDALF